jgi:hypothetical protein
MSARGAFSLARRRAGQGEEAESAAQTHAEHCKDRLHVRGILNEAAARAHPSVGAAPRLEALPFDHLPQLLAKEFVARAALQRKLVRLARAEELRRSQREERARHAVVRLGVPGLKAHRRRRVDERRDRSRRIHLETRSRAVREGRAEVGRIVKDVRGSESNCEHDSRKI